MSAVALDIDNLSVTYGQHRALERVTLQVRAGEVIGVLGPNGSGKTTLLRAITGKLGPAEGRISLQGHQLRPGKAHKHSIGFAPQALGLYKHLTARENLEVFGRFAGIHTKQLQDSVEQALIDVQLTDKANVFASRLSGGMQRRLHIAATLLSQPALLVLDEPTAGVDLAARAAIHALIRKRAAQGTAVVVVTHELDEAEELCHKLGILIRGRLHGLAPPQQLVNEAFGDTRIFVVRTENEPSPQLRTHLEEMGLVQGNNFYEWTLRDDRPLDVFVSQLTQNLRGNTQPIREVSVRRPGLNDVMRQLADGALVPEEHALD